MAPKTLKRLTEGRRNKKTVEKQFDSLIFKKQHQEWEKILKPWLSVKTNMFKSNLDIDLLSYTRHQISDKEITH